MTGTPVRAFVAAIATCLGALPTLAQADPAAWRSLGAGHAVRAVELAGSTAQAIAVVWPHAPLAGSVAMRAGSVALAAYRAAASAAALPPGAVVGHEVFDQHTVFTALLPAADAEAAAQWFAALVRPPAGDAQADALRQAAARAALSIDDADWLYPGSLLRGRARTAAGLGERPADAVACLLQWSPTAMANALAAEPAPLRVVVVGSSLGLSSLCAAIERLPVAAAASVAAVAAAPAGPGAGSGEAFTPHARVDAAYVAAALRAPAIDAQALPFAVGVAVLRARAEAAFRSYRGGEAMAGAPFVAFDLLAGDPLVVLCRRAPAAAAAPARAELESLLADVRAAPPTADEVAVAASVLAAEWAVPPWPPAHVAVLAELPQALVPRARALALLGQHGIADAMVRSLPAMSPADVVAALRPALEASAVWWGGLLPTRVDPAGW